MTVKFNKFSDYFQLLK